MTYRIKDTETFIKENIERTGADALNEGLFLSRTKSELKGIMRPTFDAGTDIFNQINERVDEVEKLVKKYAQEQKKRNKEMPKDEIEQLLTEEIDRSLLSLNHLLSKTNVKDGKFTKDVFLSSVLNYKALLKPIRAARIMALGYKYYMRLVNQSICQSLVCIELYSDTFFTSVRDAITGRQSEMQEVEAQARAQLLNSLQYSFKLNHASEKESKKFKNAIDAFAKIQQNTYNSYRYNSSAYGRSNLFTESGRSVENLMRDDNQKEIQAILGQFTNLGNAPAKDGKDNMVASFSESVKLAAEARAYKVCATIRMNMIDILKLFSIRTQDRIVNYLSGESKTSEEDHSEDVELEVLRKQADEMMEENAKLKAECEKLAKEMKEKSEGGKTNDESGEKKDEPKEKDGDNKNEKE